MPDPRRLIVDSSGDRLGPAWNPARFSNEGIQTPDPAPGTEIRWFLTSTEDACTGQRNGVN